jgi:hypothetical protein
LDVLGVCVVGDETGSGRRIFYVWYLVEYWVGVVVDIASNSITCILIFLMIVCPFISVLTIMSTGIAVWVRIITIVAGICTRNACQIITGISNAGTSTGVFIRTNVAVDILTSETCRPST